MMNYNKYIKSKQISERGGAQHDRIELFMGSIVIGKNNFWGKGKWAFTLFFGVMYMLAEYGTFKMANNIAFNKLNAPDLEMIVAGAIISAIGMLVGSLWNKKRHNQKK